MRKTVLKVSLLASALTMSMAASAASEKIVASKDVAPAGFSLDISAPPAEQKTKPKGPRLPPASKK